MTDNVIQLVPPLVGDGYKIEADKVLQAQIGRLASVALVGFTLEGELIVAGTGGAADSLLLFAQGNHYIVDNSVERWS